MEIQYKRGQDDMGDENKEIVMGGLKDYNVLSKNYYFWKGNISTTLACKLGAASL